MLLKYSTGYFKNTKNIRQPYFLYRGRSKRLIVRIIPDRTTGLYRIDWPDIGLSDLTNLSRAKEAAREWAERKALVEDRKLPVARRLKSLNNFWWSSSPMRQTGSRRGKAPARVETAARRRIGGAS